MATLFKSAAIAAVALSLLAGCSTALPTGLQARGASKVRAKLLSYEDVFAVVTNRTIPNTGVVTAGMPAVMAAPSDVLAQRGTENLFSQVVGKTLPELDPVLDASMKEAIAQELPQSLYNTDPEVNTYVQGIADRLAKAKGLPSFEAYVLDIDDWNAFNAGGTSMYIFTGLIKGVKDEAELAGVMAHEMTHGLKRHGLQHIVGSLADSAARSYVAKAHPAPKAELDLIKATMLTMTPAQRRD
ncbi:MAG: M48 family metalloprotease, partial [Candidatus Sericytochromatia bacterium]|nr:M48 family metalloprotease [Candidatus Tanganyikabacteria bacterium]